MRGVRRTRPVEKGKAKATEEKENTEKEEDWRTRKQRRATAHEDAEGGR